MANKKKRYDWRVKVEPPTCEHCGRSSCLLCPNAVRAAVEKEAKG